MPRLETQEIVNGAVTSALESAAQLSPVDKLKAVVQIRSFEAIANAIVGLELAIKEAGSQVSDVGPAIEKVAVELGGVVAGAR